MNDINELQKQIDQFVNERDWDQFHSPKNLSMAISAEAAELLEHFLWVENDKADHLLDNPVKKEAISEELADILIYAFRFASRCNIDLKKAMIHKITTNNNRYPVDKAQGKSLKYNEL